MDGWVVDGWVGGWLMGGWLKRSNTFQTSNCSLQFRTLHKFMLNVIA